MAAYTIKNPIRPYQCECGAGFFLRADFDAHRHSTMPPTDSEMLDWLLAYGYEGRGVGNIVGFTRLIHPLTREEIASAMLRGKEGERE